MNKISRNSAFFLIISFSLAVFSLAITLLAIPYFQIYRFPGLNKYLLIFFFFLCLLTPIAVWLLKKKPPFFICLQSIILIFSPSALIFSVGLKDYSKNLHFFVYFLVSVYIVGLFILLLQKYIIFVKKNNSLKINAENIPEKRKIPTFVKKNPVEIALILITVFIFLFLGIQSLGKLAAVDEPLWTFDRIPKFWNNVSDGEFYKTMISDKPGITVALISGIGLDFVNPKEYELKKENGYSVENKNDFAHFNFVFRFPILLFSALMLFLFFWLLTKLAGKEIALFSTIFIGLSPILLGISSLVNPDSLLWTFLPLSIISYFIYLKNDRKIFYLFLSGILMGLGLLTKYITNILAVYFFIIIIIEAISVGKKTRAELSNYLRLLFVDYFMLLASAVFVAFLLLPAAWENPSRLLEITLWSEAFQKTWPLFFLTVAAISVETFVFKNKIIFPVISFLSNWKKWIWKISGFLSIFFISFTLANTLLGMKWYDFESIISSPKTSASVNGFFASLSANFYSLVFGILPIILVLIILASLKNLFVKKDDENNKWIAYFSIFILFYYLASAISMVSATVRYQIVIFPIAFIIAAFGAKLFLDYLNFKKNIVFWIMSVLFILFSVNSLLFIKPHYFSYASSWLPKNYVLNLKDMGDGSYEAAQYLNGLENSKNLRVWTDKRGVCYFFSGKCSTDIEIKEDLTFDYFVISSGRENRIEKLSLTRGIHSNFPMDFRKLYETEKFRFNLEIGGRPNNYVRIISAEDISLR